MQWMLSVDIGLGVVVIVGIAVVGTDFVVVEIDSAVD